MKTVKDEETDASIFERVPLQQQQQTTTNAAPTNYY